MEEERNELVEVAKGLSKTLTELQPLVADLNVSCDPMYLELRPQNFVSLSAKYTAAIGDLDKIIRESQKALAISERGFYLSRPQTPNQQNEIISKTSQNTLTVERSSSNRKKSTLGNQVHKPHEMFEFFKNRKLPISYLPYPGLCGCLPLEEDKEIPVDSFVASKLDDEPVLCYVIGQKEGKYLVVDADSQEPVIVEKDRSECFPLPTSLPDRSTTQVEYPVGTKVLALYPDNENDWSSVFYPATVVQPPSKRSSGYGLKFEDDKFDQIDVPIQFITIDPSN